MKAKNKILLLCVLLFVPSLFYSCIAQVKKGKKEVSGKVNIMYSKTNFESGEVDWIIPFDTIFIDLDNDGLNDAFHSYYFDWGRGQSGLIYSIFLGDGKGNFNYYKDNQHLSSGDNFKIKFVESGIFSVTMLYNDKNTLEIFFEYDEKSKDWFCHKYNVYDKPKEKLLRKQKLAKPDAKEKQKLVNYNNKNLMQRDKQNNGGSSDWYLLPDNAKTLQDLIEHRNMNGAVKDIFKACYRLGIKTEDELRDLNKTAYYALREIGRVSGRKDYITIAKELIGSQAIEKE